MAVTHDPGADSGAIKSGQSRKRQQLAQCLLDVRQGGRSNGSPYRFAKTILADGAQLITKDDTWHFQAAFGWAYRNVRWNLVRFVYFEVSGTTMTRLDKPLLKASSLTIRTGRCPDCSRPVPFARSASQISPRTGSLMVRSRRVLAVLVANIDRLLSSFPLCPAHPSTWRPSLCGQPPIPPTFGDLCAALRIRHSSAG